MTNTDIYQYTNVKYINVLYVLYDTCSSIKNISHISWDMWFFVCMISISQLSQQTLFLSIPPLSYKASLKESLPRLCVHSHLLPLLLVFATNMCEAKLQLAVPMNCSAISFRVPGHYCNKFE